MGFGLHCGEGAGINLTYVNFGTFSVPCVVIVGLE